MNVFYFTVTLSVFIYGLFFETVFLKIYGSIIGLYFLGYFLSPSSKHHNLRRKLMIPCWKGCENRVFFMFFFKGFYLKRARRRVHLSEI